MKRKHLARTIKDIFESLHAMIEIDNKAMIHAFLDYQSHRLRKEVKKR